MTHLFKLLQGRYDALRPERCKLHLATQQASRMNLHQLLAAGIFDEFQSYQKDRIWSRRFVVALIQKSQKSTDRWVFAGACSVDRMMVDETDEERDRAADDLGLPRDWTRTAHHYRLRRLQACDALIGKIVRYRRDARRFDRFAEQLASQLVVHEADQKD